MDQTEYQLLARVAAGDGLLDPGGERNLYLHARLLQLRARGLVRFDGADGSDGGAAGCRLTSEGEALLASHRRAGGSGLQATG